MTLSIIVSAGEHHEIGRNNGLLCHLSADMKRVKELTTGHTIVMGRKTFDSLPKGPLPNRRNIILSRNRDRTVEGAEIYPSLSDALANLTGEDEVFIFGGGEIYRQAIGIADKIYLTVIHHIFEDADTFFPVIQPDVWEETAHSDFSEDEKNPYPYSFLTYLRKK
ncbi:MAG: dihydrofolate reductase [Tannerella sp.]|jgi:dihydrofolate reductase|nr:dihydrofolate reductase [Tannerella sp.]